MTDAKGENAATTTTETAQELACIVRAKTGDRAAQDELARRYLPLLRGYLRRYVKNGEEDDIAQKALVRAFAKLESFRGEASFKSWLMRVAKNVALNHLRDAKAGPEGRTAARELDEADLITRSLGTTRLVARETRLRLIAAVDGLPEKQRRSVQLRIFEERSFAEIAAELGGSEDSAKVNFHHAVKKLRDILGEGDPPA